MIDENRLLSLLGLCRRAGGTITGLNSFLTEIKSKRKIDVVILAHDSSERTKKQVRDKSTFYGVNIFEINIDSDKLGHALGCTSSVGVIALTGKGPMKGIIDIINNQNESIER